MKASVRREGGKKRLRRDGFVPVSVHYNGDDAGEKERLAAFYGLNGVLQTLRTIEGETVRWKRLSANLSLGSIGNDCAALVDSVALQSADRSPDYRTVDDALILLTANISALLDPAELQRSLTFSDGRGKNMRQPLGAIDDVMSTILRSANMTMFSAMTAGTAIEIGKRFRGLNFLSRAGNFSIDSGGTKRKSIADFKSCVDMMARFFPVSRDGARIASSLQKGIVLKDGDLAIPGCALQSTDGKRVMILVQMEMQTSQGIFTGTSHDFLAWGVLWDDSSVSESTGIPLSIATPVVRRLCRRTGAAGVMGSGLSLLPEDGNAAEREVRLVWLDHRRGGQLGSTTWETNLPSIRHGPSVTSFGEVVGTLLLSAPFVIVRKCGIESCTAAKDALARVCLLPDPRE